MKRNGFTLIELLIVIAVISILIGIALPRFKGMREEGNAAKAKAELRTLQTAIESYYIHNTNAFPTALSNLTSQTPKIINSVPKDPFNGSSNYGYARSGDNNYYVVWSVGPGGGTSDTVSVDNSGTITETTAASNIYVSNAAQDSQP